MNPTGSTDHVLKHMASKDEWETKYPNLKGGQFRFVWDYNKLKPPLTKRHLITHSPKAAFSGPHTAIKIPHGPDKGCWLHVPVRLTDDEAAFASTAISWVWTDFAHSDGGKPGFLAIMSGRSRAPKPFYAISTDSWKLLGPPGAEYPLTDSVDAPFAGPRTVLYNAGLFFKGLYMHVPRFLTSSEVKVAETNLRYLCNRRWEWGKENEVRQKLHKNRQKTEEAIVFLQQQKKAVKFLEKDIFLDFSAQDRETDTTSGLALLWCMEPDLLTEYEDLASVASSHPSEDDLDLRHVEVDSEEEADARATYKRRSEFLKDMERKGKTKPLYDPVTGKPNDWIYRDPQGSRYSGSTVSSNVTEIIDGGSWPSPPAFLLGNQNHMTADVRKEEEGSKEYPAEDQQRPEEDGSEHTNSDLDFPTPDALGEILRPPGSEPEGSFQVVNIDPGPGPGVSQPKRPPSTTTKLDEVSEEVRPTFNYSGAELQELLEAAKLEISEEDEASSERSEESVETRSVEAATRPSNNIQDKRMCDVGEAPNHAREPSNQIVEKSSDPLEARHALEENDASINERWEDLGKEYEEDSTMNTPKEPQEASTEETDEDSPLEAEDDICDDPHFEAHRARELKRLSGVIGVEATEECKPITTVEQAVEGQQSLEAELEEAEMLEAQPKEYEEDTSGGSKGADAHEPHISKKNDGDAPMDAEAVELGDEDKDRQSSPAVIEDNENPESHAREEGNEENALVDVEVVERSNEDNQPSQASVEYGETSEPYVYREHEEGEDEASPPSLQGTKRKGDNSLPLPSPRRIKGHTQHVADSPTSPEDNKTPEPHVGEDQDSSAVDEAMTAAEQAKTRRRNRLLAAMTTATAALGWYAWRLYWENDTTTDNVVIYPDEWGPDVVLSRGEERQLVAEVLSQDYALLAWVIDDDLRTATALIAGHTFVTLLRGGGFWPWSRLLKPILRTLFRLVVGIRAILWTCGRQGAMAASLRVLGTILANALLAIPCYLGAQIVSTWCRSQEHLGSLIGAFGLDYEPYLQTWIGLSIVLFVVVMWTAATISGPQNAGENGGWTRRIESCVTLVFLGAGVVLGYRHSDA